MFHLSASCDLRRRPSNSWALCRPLSRAQPTKHRHYVLSAWPWLGRLTHHNLLPLCLPNGHSRLNGGRLQFSVIHCGSFEGVVSVGKCISSRRKNGRRWWSSWQRCFTASTNTTHKLLHFLVLICELELCSFKDSGDSVRRLYNWEGHPTGYLVTCDGECHKEYK